MEEQLQELFSFLHDQREDVRQLAVSNVAGLTKSQEFIPFFIKNNGETVKTLMAMKKDHPLIAHDSLSALVNLSAHDSVLPFMDDETFIYSLVLTIVIPHSVLADLCCMLLNNMSKYTPIATRLIPPSPTISNSSSSHSENSSETQTKQRKTPLIDNLLEVFVRGDPAASSTSDTSSSTTNTPQQPQTTTNPPRKATYHFLAGVFANVSAIPLGAKCLRSRSRVDNVIRLAKLLPFTEHSDALRRGGCIAAIKNCCYDVEAPQEDTGGVIVLERDSSGTPTKVTAAEALEYDRGLLLSAELNLLPYILLPLCGPEDFDDDDMEGMPEELQLLEPGKKREPDARLRLMLVETLLLLTATRPGREHLRQKRAYPVIRNMHAAETVETVMERAERLVNLLMRDEADAAAATSTATTTVGPTTTLDKAKNIPARAKIEEVESDSDDDGDDIKPSKKGEEVDDLAENIETLL